jgi:hypothetical protein
MQEKQLYREFLSQAGDNSQCFPAVLTVQAI